MKTYTIYKITNRINNKVYIGQTSRKLSHRWADHKRQSTSGKRFHLHEAMLKYGVANFIIEEIEKLGTQLEANQRERYWIQYYDAIENGYNICSGPEDHATMGSRSWTTLTAEQQQVRTSQMRNGLERWKNSLSLDEKSKVESKRIERIVEATNNPEYKEALSLRVTAWWENMPTNEKEELSKKYSQSKSKKYVVTNPEGEEFKIVGLKQFCDENKLHQGAMNALAKGKGKTYKGWQCRYDEL